MPNSTTVTPKTIEAPPAIKNPAEISLGEGSNIVHLNQFGMTKIVILTC